MTTTTTTFVFGTIKGRHEMPVDEFVFMGDIVDPTDTITIDKGVKDFFSDKGIAKGDTVILYVTGLTVVTTAIIAVAARLGVKLTLKHFDMVSKDYFDQVIFD